jgi:flagellar basal body rod protein FlgG
MPAAATARRGGRRGTVLARGKRASMNRAVYTVTSGGIAALDRLEAVAQNLANASTAGYKAQRVVFRVRPLEVDGPERLDPILSRTAAQVVEVATVRDFSQGPIRQSGNALDVAIGGDGFFVVSTPRGERYTRQGSFTRDGEGYLVTEHGERVQGDGGDISVGAGDAAIGEDGTLSVDGIPGGRLKVVTFGDHPALEPEGATLFAPARGVTPTVLDATAVRLHPGALEAANIDPTAGMIELVDVSRGFETYMHAMRRLDEVAQQAINDVGRV